MAPAITLPILSLFLTTLTSALPQPTTFNLLTNATNGDPSFSNLYITTSRTDTNPNILVTTTINTKALNFEFNNTYLSALGVGNSSQPYTLHLRPPLPPNTDPLGPNPGAVPDEYNPTAIDAGFNRAGFFQTNESEVLRYVGPEDLRGFVLCDVNGDGEGDGAQAKQLFWREMANLAVSHGCAGVELSVVSDT